MAIKKLAASGVLYDERRQFYMNPQVTKELWTTVAPFTTIIANRNTISGIPDPLFKQFEHRDYWRNMKLTTTTADTVADSDTGTALTISATVGLPAAASIDSSFLGYELEVWDSTLTTLRGQCVITAASASSITVKNLSTTAFTTVSGDILYVIGHISGEGSTAPDAWSDELRIVWGSTQMLETSIEVTGHLYQAALRGYSSELARLRALKSREHKVLQERVGLFGGSLIGTGLNPSGSETFSDGFRTAVAGSAPLRSTMGLVTAIEKYGSAVTTNDDQNIFSIVEGSYKYSNFVDDMEKVFHYYPDGPYKPVMCGPGAISFWSKLDTNMAGKSGWKINLGPSQTTSLGFNVRQLETPHGTLGLINTPAFLGPRNKWMVVLTDENLSFVQYQRDQFLANIKTEDNYKGEKDVYFSDMGVGLTLIESHKLFKIV